MCRYYGDIFLLYIVVIRFVNGARYGGQNFLIAVGITYSVREKVIETLSWRAIMVVIYIVEFCLV